MLAAWAHTTCPPYLALKKLGRAAFGSTGGKISLTDPYSEPFEHALNGDFYAFTAGAAWGIGYGYSAIKIGSATTTGWSVMAGAGGGIAEYSGTAIVESFKKMECGRDK